VPRFHHADMVRHHRAQLLTHDDRISAFWLLSDADFDYTAQP
jgi:hypothetical protein